MIILARTTRVVAIAFLLAIGGGRAAMGQGTSLVPVSDLAYRDLNRLADLGLLDSVVIGQRPWSRREIGRLVRGARSTSSADSPFASAEVRAIMERLHARFADDETRVDLFSGASLTATSTNIARRGLVGFAREVEATIGPFGDRRLGRPEMRGETLALELEQRADPLSWLGVMARERVEARAPRDTVASHGDGEVLLANVRARYRNLAVTAGRSAIAWAQHRDDGLLLAADAPALDQLSLTGDRPFVLPGVLSRLGAVQGTLVYAALGATAVRSHSKLLAYKLSAAPSSDVEIGGTFLDHFGGEGARPASVGNRIIDFLPFIDIFRRHNYADTTAALEVESDKALALDGRLRLSRLGGIVLAGEMEVDDFDVHRLRTLLTWDGSQTLDILVPRLPDGRFSLDLSVKHTGVRIYSHHQLTGGLVTRGRLFGNELGNDAKAFGATLGFTPAPAVRMSLEARSAIHSKGDYRIFSSGTAFAIFRTGPASNELRDRLVGTFEAQSAAGHALVVRLGGVRLRNYAFTGTTRHEYLADVSLRFAR